MNELVKASPAAAPMIAETCEREPEENTERLLSMLRGAGCSVVIKHRLTFPTNPSTGEPSGWRDVVKGAEVVVAPGANLDKALRTVEASMAPAAPPNIGMWLAELGHITARRNESADSATVTMAAYIKRLIQYPGDIVRQTLQEWSGKWFPTWGELKEILDARIAPRLAIRNAISGVSPNMAGRALPAAYETMDEEGKAQWLRKEAEWARRSDPEWSAELIERAEELEESVRDRMQGQGA